eukprot:GEZU01024072.1.p2 GENE.GEZU01024072.1~~GEZU01024072.1.p2  ORF type:complete len:202 (+),score=51.59 GEZU01024072.1:168-773(+)
MQGNLDHPYSSTHTYTFIGGRSWQVAETLSQPELRNSIEEVIVVGIHPLDRMREMTHTTFRWNGEERPSGGLREYTAYVADVLKPWIDLNYRTDDAASKTAVCGSSLGGLAAFYMAGTRPDCFGIGACFSSAFGVGLDPSDTIAGSELMRLVEKNLSSSSNSNRICNKSNLLSTSNNSQQQMCWTTTNRLHLANVPFTITI